MEICITEVREGRKNKTLDLYFPESYDNKHNNFGRGVT